MRLTNLFDQEYQQPQAQAGDIFELELNDNTVIETTIAEVDEEGNIALYLDETAINMIEQAGMLTEAAPALVRGALGFAAGGIAAAGTPALVAILGPILGIGVGAAGAYNATKLAMKGADDIWDWAAKKLGGDEHEFAMTHIRAAAAGEDQFTVGGKTYPVTLKKNQVQPAIQAVKSVAESRIEEARKTNTNTARAEFGKRTKKPTLSPQEQDQKKSESDEAWARLMAYADQQKNKTVEESQEHSPVAQAITRRIMLGRTDLLSKYGPELVTDAIDDVADWVGDVDEIGSSDVSAWVRQVEDYCARNHNQYPEPMDVGDDLDEAKYHGKEVTLGKPVRGGPKKFYVYVRDPSTKNIKKVNFGDPNMRIKKSSPKHRKSFRARHNCASPGPRTKARYWSCRKW